MLLRLYGKLGQALSRRTALKYMRGPSRILAVGFFQPCVARQLATDASGVVLESLLDPPAERSWKRLCKEPACFARQRQEQDFTQISHKNLT